jgi:hypothetical protein
MSTTVCTTTRGRLAQQFMAAFGQQAPNPSFERTRTGMPLQAFISFWALRVLPARAAQLKR